MTPSPLSVRARLAGRHLLITGVTGFLGKVQALMLLRDVPEIGGITVLARGRKGEDAVERVQRLLGTSPALRPLRAAHGAGLAAFLAEKIDVLPGDVAEPGCGVDPATVARLRGRYDLVLHFAGLTDFQPDPPQALLANTDGAVHVADLCAAIGAPLLHVSTAYVAGRVSGDVAEALEPDVSPLGIRFDPRAEVEAIRARLAELPTGRAERQVRVDAIHARAEALGWPNLYTFSKALGERLIATRDDVHTTIVRPTIVECARAFPFAGWNEGVNTSAPLAWLISTPFRDFPSRAHHRFDIAPVDLVCRGITLVAADILGGGGGGVLHLGTSGDNPVTYGRIIELTGLANRRRLRDDPTVKPWEKLLVPHLDPVAVDADARPPWHVSRLRRGLDRARRLLDGLDAERAPTPLRDAIAELRKRGLKSTNEQARLLARIETMLDLFQPFVHDHDYRFRNERVRALSARLPADEAATFGYDSATIDWRNYWYDVQYPGLWTWSIPLLRGERAPTDPPPEPPLRLRRAAPPALTLAASRPADPPRRPADPPSPRAAAPEAR
jgi:nucleoside-diphosphate-sugar epimerase